MLEKEEEMAIRGNYIILCFSNSNWNGSKHNGLPTTKQKLSSVASNQIAMGFIFYLFIILELKQLLKYFFIVYIEASWTIEIEIDKSV